MKTTREGYLLGCEGAAQNRTALQRAVQEVSVRPNEHGVDEWTVLDQRIRTEEIGVGLDGVTGWNGGSDCTGSCPVRRTRSDRLDHVVQIIVLEVRHQRDAQTARLVPHVRDGTVAEGSLVWMRRMEKTYVDR